MGRQSPPLEALATPEYWDERYEGEKSESSGPCLDAYDWFRTFDKLRSYLEERLPSVAQSPRLLHLGCGNSTLTQDLHERGYLHQTNVDFSPIVIDAMQTKYAELHVEWLVMDVRHMKFSSACFDIAIDKGTLDAMLHGSLWDPPEDVRQSVGSYVDEVGGDASWGLLQLNPPSYWPEHPTVEYDLDIVAIHGLGGHRSTTWTHQKGKRLWLKDDLPNSVPGARVYTFGYDSGVFLSQSTAFLREWASQLLEEVTMVRQTDPERTRPIIFVCHSLGGIVCKKALVIANEQSRFIELLRQTKAVIFFGTPHQGSEIAVLGKVASQVLNAITNVIAYVKGLSESARSDLVGVLKPQSNDLTELTFSFQERANSMHIVSFYETHVYPPFGKVIVSKASARVGSAKEDFIPIPADHREMCRLSGPDDPVFRVVVNVCQQYGKARNPIVTKRDLSNDEQKLLGLLKGTSLQSMRYSLPKRIPGTCEWIRANTKFNDWYSEGQRPLWILGNMGCGKTVILAYILDFIKQEWLAAQRESRQSMVCSFFCDNKDSIRREYRQLLRAILRQILKRRHDLIHHALPLLKSTSIELLETTLLKVLKSYSGGTVFLIIDAVDEMDRASQVAFASFIGEFLKGSYPNVRIVISSRPTVPEITTQVENPSYLKLWENGCLKAIRSDIQHMIDSGLHGLNKQQFSSNQLHRIRQQLEENAECKFLWAKLTLDRIKNSSLRSEADLEELIKELPADLKDIYASILSDLCRLTDRERQFAIEALEMLTCASRPMTVDEVRYGLSIKNNMSTLEETVRYRQPDIEGALQRLLTPLIEIQSGTIRLIHTSLKEYLIDSSSPQSSATSFRLDIVSAHGDMVRRCKTFLCFDEFKQQDIFNFNLTSMEQLPMNINLDSQSDDESEQQLWKTPFFQYASQYWAEHVSNCEQVMSDDELDTVAELSHSDSFCAKNWSEQFRRSTNEWAVLPDKLDPLVVSVFFGHQKMVRHLYRRKTYKSTLDGDHAFIWAARLGDLNALKLIADHEHPDLYKRDDGNSALSWAAKNGRLSVVQYLLATMGMDVNTTDEYGRSLLSLAAHRGHLNLVKFLMSREDIDIDLCDTNGDPALFWAIGSNPSRNDLRIFSLFVQDTRCKLNRRNSKKRTVLSYAAEVGADEMISDLLKSQRGEIDELLEDVGDLYGRSPLSWAAFWGRTTTVEILCKTRKIGKQLRSLDNEGKNGVTTAVDKNFVDTVKLLGWYEPLTLNVPDQTGRTPLSAAMWADRGNSIMVRYLAYSKHVDINRPDDNGRTPVSFAAGDGRLEAIRVLVCERDADYKKADNDGHDPLYYLNHGYRAYGDSEVADEIEKVLTGKWH